MVHHVVALFSKIKQNAWGDTCCTTFSKGKIPLCSENVLIDTVVLRIGTETWDPRGRWTRSTLLYCIYLVLFHTTAVMIMLLLFSHRGASLKITCYTVLSTPYGLQVKGGRGGGGVIFFFLLELYLRGSNEDSLFILSPLRGAFKRKVGTPLNLLWTPTHIQGGRKLSKRLGVDY